MTAVAKTQLWNPQAVQWWSKLSGGSSSSGVQIGTFTLVPPHSQSSKNQLEFSCTPILYYTLFLSPFLWVSGPSVEIRKYVSERGAGKAHLPRYKGREIWSYIITNLKESVEPNWDCAEKSLLRCQLGEGTRSYCDFSFPWWWNWVLGEE